MPPMQKPPSPDSSGPGGSIQRPSQPTPRESLRSRWYSRGRGLRRANRLGRFDRERQLRWCAAVVVPNTDGDLSTRLHSQGDTLIAVVALV